MRLTLRTGLKVSLLVVATTIVVSAAAFSWMKIAPRHVPEGQPALSTLSADSLAGFRQAFNAAEGEVRVLAMLSPT